MATALKLFKPFGLGMRYRDVEEKFSNAMSEVNESHIDDEKKIIKNVCIFGRRESDNGYTYEDGAIDALTQMSEGVKCFINHPSKQEIKDRDGVRDLRDWAGVYHLPRRSGEKIFGDLHVREAYWDLTKDIALMKPAKVGNSINARVKVFVDDAGKESVIGVDKLHSSDLVASGATIENLWESTDEKLNKEEEKAMEKMSAVLQEHFPKMLADIKEGILADELKQDEIRRKANNLMWKANDLIYEALRDENIKKFSEKKKKVASILDDLENELNKIMPKIKPEKEGDDTEQIVISMPRIIIPDAKTKEV